MLENMTPSTILIPDIHGRKFWEDALPYIEQGVHTVFMGDYLDVYPHEFINPNDAIENFKKILEIAKTHDNMEMLFGNHDTAYAMDRYICDCRTDYENFTEIRGLFKDNYNLFKLCTKVTAGDKTFMVSHAGIHPFWLKQYKVQFEKLSEKLGVKFEHIDTFLNDTLLKPFGKDFDSNKSEENREAYLLAVTILSACSEFRGGYSDAGSLLWADIHEFHPHILKLDRFKYEQIVGHTMQYGTAKPLSFYGIITCIDCFDCFFLDEEGDLRRLKDGVLAEDI